MLLPKPQQSLAALLKPSRHKQTISRSLDMCFFIDVSSSPLSISANPMEPLPAGLEKLTQLIKHQSCHHIETSQLICRANQLTGLYMMLTLAFNELIRVKRKNSKSSSLIFVSS